MRSDKYKTKPNELCLYLSWVYDFEYLFGYLMLIMTICIILVVILYVYIYLALRKMFQSKLGTTGLVSILTWIKDQKNQENPESAVIGILKVREVKVTCVMFTTVVSFILCWIPCIIIVIFNTREPNKVETDILVSYIFPKIYSMINPIFYAYAIKNVRKAFKRNVRKILRRKLDENENEKKIETLQNTL